MTVTQDRTYDADYHRCCAGLGVTLRFRIVYYDYWIKRFHAQFDYRVRKHFERARRSATSPEGAGAGSPL